MGQTWCPTRLALVNGQKTCHFDPKTKSRLTPTQLAKGIKRWPQKRLSLLNGKVSWWFDFDPYPSLKRQSSGSGQHGEAFGAAPGVPGCTSDGKPHQPQRV